MKEFDLSFYNEQIKIIAGIDEAGRGPLAGPVVAAAVIFDKDTIIEGINDSKLLNEQVREKLFIEIKHRALAFGLGIVNHDKIDRINILQATLLAMKKASAKLSLKPDLILIDGNKSFSSNIKTKTIIKGDSKSFSVAAASILAKVTRDRIMKRAAKKYPVYFWNNNKGYGTRQHIAAIRENGISPFHRKTFLGKILPDNDQITFH